MRYTYGRNYFDRVPQARSTSVAEFVSLLRDQRQEKPATKWWKENTTPFVAPYLMKAGTEGKTVENIERFGAWLAADVDYGWTFAELVARYEGVAAIIFTTTMSRPEAPRLRVITLLDREYTLAEHPSLWQAQNLLLGGTVDPATKNPNRLFYAPQLWTGADNQFAVSDGVPLKVDDLLAIAPTIAAVTTTQVPVSALSGAPAPLNRLVTPAMVERFIAAPEGGRFYRLLAAMAARAKERGWAVSAEEIRAAAVEVDRELTGKPRPNASAEAEHAITWAEASITTLDPLARARRRMLYQITRPATTKEKA